MKNFWFILPMTGLLLSCTVAYSEANTLVLLDLDQGIKPQSIQYNAIEGEEILLDGVRLVALQFNKVSWPNIFFSAPEGSPWNWEGYSGLRVLLHNPNAEPVTVALRVDNPGDIENNTNTVLASIPAHADGEVTLYFSTSLNQALSTRFWGMRGIPNLGPVATGPALDLSAIIAWQLFLPQPDAPVTLHLKRAWLIQETAGADEIAFPFIDMFGQYLHANWPGKTQNLDDLEEGRNTEKISLSASVALKDRDEYGGWVDGPQLEATGWFRTEKLEDQWWLVTPSGHLFFSTGMDCVGTWQRTFVTGRDDWFTWLPEEDDPLFKPFYGYAENVHSMADAIGGKGAVFGFYGANLLRKYGDNWNAAWRETTYKRLQSWGFNTLGNWSQHDVLINSPIPFVTSGNINGVPPIEGATGYWGKMLDVYDPSFTVAVEKMVAGLLKAHGDNPMCIGYFIDNELSWEGVALGALRSAAGQPARIAMLDFLKNRYADLEALNKAWGQGWQSWEEVSDPRKRNTAIKQDQHDFLYQFALRYFRTIQDAFTKQGSKQLYLGCRFSSAPDAAVQACAEVADVCSFNLYQNSLDCKRWTENNTWDKPVIIGEFHFGALDRGMFHTGLVATENQADRAKHYVEYVRSVAACPQFVGCHWFQYVDEPTTGRYYDGENYNIGFVNVADTPYPEMVDAARRVHGEIYERRYTLK